MTAQAEPRVVASKPGLVLWDLGDGGTPLWLPASLTWDRIVRVIRNANTGDETVGWSRGDQARAKRLASLDRYYLLRDEGLTHRQAGDESGLRSYPFLWKLARKAWEADQ